MAQLYQIEVVKRLPLDDNGGCLPVSLCVGSKAHLCISSGRMVYLHCLEDPLSTARLQFDSTVDSLSWSRDGALLAVGEREGIIHFVSPVSSDTLLSQCLPAVKTEGSAAYQGMWFAPSGIEGTYDLVVLDSAGAVFRLQNVSRDNIGTSSEESGQKTDRIGDIPVTQLHLSSHGSSVSALLPLHSTTRPTLISAGSGGYPLCVWEKAADEAFALSDSISYILQGATITKCAVSSDETYLVTLTSSRMVAVWLLSTLVVVSVWSGDGSGDVIDDIAVCQSTASNEDVRLCPSVLCVVADSAGMERFLQILTLPLLDVIYRVPVLPTAVLCKGHVSEEAIFFIDICEAGDQSQDIARLEVRQLVQTQPENRLKTLLKQQKFKEAEEFAQNFNLDPELVHKCRSQVTNVLLCSAISTAEQAAIATDLIQCLEQVEDSQFVAQLVLTSSYPSLDVTLDMLQFAQKKVLPQKRSKNNDNLVDIRVKVCVALNRLTTFQLVHGERDFSASVWHSFHEASLLEELRHFLEVGDLQRAGWIWNRHQSDLLSQLDCNNLPALVQAVPESVPSSQLSSWISSTVLPFTLRHFPGLMGGVFQWVEQSIRTLELTEKKEWPRNALTMVNTVLDTVQSFRHDSVHISIQPVTLTPLDYPSEGPSPLAGLLALQEALTDIDYLLSSLQCPISLSDYEKENREVVAFRLLDKVIAAELIGPTVKAQVLPYATKHKLRLDNVLSHYIEQFLVQAPRYSSSLSGSPWETKAIAILQNIDDQELYVGGCVEVLKRSQMPWSDAVEALVQECLKLDHPSVSLLQKQYELLQLKRMLQSYGVRDFNFSDTSKGYLYIRRILTQSKPEVLKDAIKVADMYQLNKAEVYMHYIINSGRRGVTSSSGTKQGNVTELEAAIEMLRGLAKTEQLSTLEKAFSFAHTRLQMCSSVDRNEPADYISALQVAIICLKELKGLVNQGSYCTICEDQSTIDAKIDLLERLLSFQSEYSLLLTPGELSDKQKCQTLFKQKVEEFVDIQGDATLNSASLLNSKHWHKVFKFCQLLGYSEESVLATVVSVYSTRRNGKAASELCHSLVERSTHGNVEAALLMQSVDDLWTLVRDDPRSMGLGSIRSAKLLSAAVVCAHDPENLLDALEQYQLCSLLCMMYEQSEDDIDTVDPSPDDSCERAALFREWAWAPRFKEEALILDRSSAMSLAVSYAQARLPSVGKPKCFQVLQTAFNPTDNGQRMLTASSKLGQLLLDNGHNQLALHCAVQTLLAYSMHVALAEGDSVSSDTMALLHDKCGFVESVVETLCGKVTSSRRMEHDYALGLLLVLPPQLAMGQLQRLRTRLQSASNYSSVIALCKLAIDYSLLNNQPAMVELATRLLTSAEWGKKLSKFKISFTEAFRGGAPEKRKVVLELMHSKEVDMELLLQYCKDFNLDVPSALLKFLRVLLTEWEEGYQERASAVLGKLGPLPILAEQLAGLLHTMITPYDYERIAFILQQLVKVEAAKQVFPEKGLLLLECLNLYSREKPPSAFEKQWFTEYYCCPPKDENPTEVVLPPLSISRLPFHLLLYGSPKEIIETEVSKSSIEKLLPIAEILELSGDDLYSFAIKNIITDRQTHSSSSSADFVFEEVAPYLAKVQDCNRALVITKWLAKELHSDLAKIKSLKCALDIAKEWREQAQTEDEQQNASSRMTVFQKLLKITQTECLLATHGLKVAEYMQLSNQGALLIIKLYTELPIKKLSVPVHVTAADIAAIYNLNLEKIKTMLIEKWLPSSSCAKQDMDVTQMSMLEDPTELFDEETEDEKNMKRLIYLLNVPANLEAHSLLLLNWAKRTSSGASSLSRVRALQVLFAIAPTALVESISGAPISDIRDFMQQALFVAKLESLHISTSLSAFQSCNKEGLVKSIWRNHSHEPKAIYLVCEMCLFYQLYNPALWGSILEQLYMKMLPYLRNVLRVLVSTPAHWNITTLPSIWQKALLAPFHEAAGAQQLTDKQREECSESLSLLQGCPFPYTLDIEALVKAYCDVEMRGHALSSALLIPSRSQRHKTVEIVFSELDQERMCALMEELTDDGKLSVVLKLVYCHIDSTNRHELLLGSQYFTAFVNFLITTRMLSNLVAKTLKVNRIKEAIQLVEMYNSHHQTTHLKGEEALKEYLINYGLDAVLYT